MFECADVKYVTVTVPVSHEEDMPKDFPFREGDTFSFTVSHPSGRIVDFPIDYNFPTGWLDENQGVGTQEEVDDNHTFFLYMKVVDTGTYTLLDGNMNVLASIDEDYVPDNTSIPGDYGDYMDLVINIRTGIIENWYGERAKFCEFMK